MRTLRGITTVLALLLFCIASAEASPITGGFSMAGNFLPVNGQTGSYSPLGTSTAFDFTPGTFLVTLGSGSLMFSDVSFGGMGNASFPSLPNFNNLTFTLNSASLGAGGQSSTSLSLAGVQVPEPASLALLGGGLLVGAATLNRRRRRANR